MTKNGKKETRHLVASTDTAVTICGRPVGKVLLWAKKYEPGAETMSVCGWCGALKAGREIDGWTFWSYLKADGTLEKIDALRKAVA